MRFFSTHGPRRHSRACASLCGVGALSAVLLSGCGGGGGINGTSVSDQGFRIVPAGGTVTPLPSVSLATQAGVVSTGIQVSASALPDATVTNQATPTYLQSVPNGASTTALVQAYQITFSPDNPAIAADKPVVLTLAYTNTTIPVDGNTKSAFDPATSFRIYFFDSSNNQWVALPRNTVQASANTVTATLGTLTTTTQSNGTPILPNLKSGVYAIFATTSPTVPTVPTL